MKKIKVLRLEVTNTANNEAGVLYITLRAKLRGIVIDDKQDLSYGLNIYYNSLKDDLDREQPRYLKNFVLFREELESAVHSQTSMMLEDLGYQLKLTHYAVRVLDFSAWSCSDVLSDRSPIKVVTKADKWYFHTINDEDRKGYYTSSPLVAVVGLMKDMLANPVVGEDSVLFFLQHYDEEVELINLTKSIYN